MQAVYYGKGIAVQGDTRPWKENLKALGGKFSKGLAGGPGWVFSKQDEPELMQFIADAQAGNVQPLAAPAPVAYPGIVPTPQMVPFGHVQPAMTPQAAMARLAVAQPGAVQVPRPPSPNVPRPQPGMVYPPRPGTPQAPQAPQPAPQLLTLGFPAMAKDASGLTYQIVMYTLPMPSIGQHIDITVGENILPYSVAEVSPQSGYPVTSFLIKQELETEEEPVVSRVIISDGKWKVDGLADEHTITFHPQ